MPAATRFTVDVDGAITPPPPWAPPSCARWSDLGLGLPWARARALTGCARALLSRGGALHDVSLTRDGAAFALTRDGGLDAATVRLFARLHAVSRALLHDVRSSLSGATSSLEMLLLDDGLTASARSLAAESVDEIVRSAERIRARHARFPPVEGRLAHVTPAELLGPVVAAMRWEAARRRLGFEAAFDPSLGVVSVVPAAVVAAAVNLCHNALDAAPDGSTVSLSVSRVDDVDGPWLEVATRDEGPRPSDELFARAGVVGFSTRRERQGLGLAAARLAASLQGGSLTLQRDGDQTLARAVFRDGVAAALGTDVKAI